MDMESMIHGMPKKCKSVHQLTLKISRSGHSTGYVASNFSRPSFGVKRNKSSGLRGDLIPCLYNQVVRTSELRPDSGISTRRCTQSQGALRRFLTISSHRGGLCSARMSIGSLIDLDHSFRLVWPLLQFLEGALLGHAAWTRTRTSNVIPSGY